MRDHGPATGGTSADARTWVKERFFSAQRRGGTEAKRITAAGNAIGSARHWGLLNDDDTLTDVGRAALAAPNDEAARLLVEHFLRHLGGAQIAKAILDLIRANEGVAPKKTALAAALHEAGIYENRDGTDHSAVLGWLAHPGVRVVAQHGRGRWSLDEQRFTELAGVTSAQVDAVARRDPVQLALLVELARSAQGQSDSGTMQRILAARADLDVQAPGFRRLYLDPLARDGLIEIGGRAGRGATGFSITDLGSTRGGRRPRLTLRRRRHAALPARRPAASDERVVADLDPADQPDRNRRGIALEHLALRMIGWIGLTNVRWRVRPGGQAEEIDGTAHALAPSFARWQVQAKNTARLDADDAAKEIGLAITNGAAVVMLITTGGFTAAARSVIERAERRGGLAFICLDGRDVRAIASDPAQLRNKLDREAARARSRHVE